MQQKTKRITSKEPSNSAHVKGKNQEIYLNFQQMSAQLKDSGQRLQSNLGDCKKQLDFTEKIEIKNEATLVKRILTLEKEKQLLLQIVEQIKISKPNIMSERIMDSANKLTKQKIILLDLEQQLDIVKKDNSSLKSDFSKIQKLPQYNFISSILVALSIVDNHKK